MLDSINVIEIILGWLMRLTDMILCALQQFVCWAVEALYDFFAPLAQAALELIPDGSLSWITDLTGLFEIANNFLPITETLILALAYYTFLTAFVVVKLILKLIPTVGDVMSAWVWAGFFFWAALGVASYAVWMKANAEDSR